MRTDAKNLVTTASTTRHKESIHMIAMMRKEVCSGGIADLGHVTTHGLSWDMSTRAIVFPIFLTKHSGIIPELLIVMWQRCV